MGMIALPASGKVYVDTCSLIYAVERIEPYFSASVSLWAALSAGRQAVLTSELALLEVLVKPLRIGDAALVALYRNVLLGTAGLTCLPVSLAVLQAAAELRARFNLKTPDAIHAATALEAGSVMFVTNDSAFRRVPGLNVEVLSEIAAR
jgi:predicted nucleic acid-binding protein